MSAHYEACDELAAQLGANIQVLNMLLSEACGLGMKVEMDITDVRQIASAVENWQVTLQAFAPTQVRKEAAYDVLHMHRDPGPYSGT